MIELAREYGPSAVTLLILAGAVLMLVRQRTVAGRWSGDERRVHTAEQLATIQATVTELREDVKDVRRNVYELRSELQPIIRDLAVVSHRVGDLEARVRDS